MKPPRRRWSAAVEALEPRALLSAGALDRTFSKDGTDLQDITNKVDAARAVAIQSNGKIVVAGTSGTSSGSSALSSDSNFTLLRYNTDGTLDRTFGRGGKVTDNVSPG